MEVKIEGDVDTNRIGKKINPPEKSDFQYSNSFNSLRSESENLFFDEKIREIYRCNVKLIK